MPDISMCLAKNCRASDTCRRHADSGTVPTPERQSYMAFEPDDGGACDAYWLAAPATIQDDQPYDIAPDSRRDGRIVRKHIEDTDA